MLSWKEDDWGDGGSQALLCPHPGVLALAVAVWREGGRGEIFMKV